MSTPSPADCQQVAPGWRAYDVTPEDVAPLAERFGWYHEPGEPDECWVWGGPYFKGTGYGKISRTSRLAQGQHLLAHRVAWVLATGESLTDDLTIDHICVNRLCVNPGHLEPVSLLVNVSRRHTRRNEPRTHRVIPDAELAEVRERTAARVERLRREKISADRAAAQARLGERVACGGCGRLVRRDGLQKHVAAKCARPGRRRRAA